LDEVLLVVFILWSDGSFRYQHEAIMGFHIRTFRIHDPSFQGLAAFPLLKAFSQGLADTLLHPEILADISVECRPRCKAIVRRQQG
jgi:hypothetical protein